MHRKCSFIGGLRAYWLLISDCFQSTYEISSRHWRRLARRLGEYQSNLCILLNTKLQRISERGRVIIWIGCTSSVDNFILK
uniref:AlNc14C47G3759 protein n=1 Tax=Albugo laibachii Nc14 TaxID=890382 RepID=F0WAP5_9STRA|nr:AlNc14C47G3759 [Albugo laibachii Nc14]|eukprot:CCA18216.1 AlNc14C47G3759 [Albugo laibachii Nc14]